MIERSNGYKVGQQFFTTLLEAQREALANLLALQTGNDLSVSQRALHLMEHAEEVVAILSPSKELRPRKPRKDKGVRRKNASAAIPATNH